MGEESNEEFFSVTKEWSGIHERLKKVPYQMKLQIKEVLCQLAFLETTMLSPPPRKLPQTKGAKKKVRSKANEAPTSQIPSSCEVADSQFLDS